MKAEISDKVRVKVGAYAGNRGVVAEIQGEQLTVRLENAGPSMVLSADEVTNYSLAARKAWKSAPGRRVGRRKGTKLHDRISVTLRIDRELWDDFRQKESDGLIDDRTATVNAWLREKLAELDSKGR